MNKRLLLTRRGQMQVDKNGDTLQHYTMQLVETDEDRRDRIEETKANIQRVDNQIKR